nr:alginate export family protein [uncultured Methylophaga sp.]
MPKQKKLSVVSLLSTGLASIALLPATVVANDSFYDALTGGKVSFSARLRYESVDQDNSLKDADAVTLRTTLGYKTDDYHGFGAFLELEDVSDLAGNYEEYPQTAVKKYSVIADPNGTEVNQAYLSYNGFNTEVKLGRQELTYRDAPFHRFIGNVLWRQNHQSFDAVSLSNTSIKDLKLSYAYINKVNTIFGDDLTAGLIDDGVIDMDSHLFNMQYSGLSIGKLEAYGYLLDYEDTAKDNANSTATYGVRLSGAKPVNEDFAAIYTAEYATQHDYADGKMDPQDYYLVELGGKYQGWLAKLSYEVQEGDGTYSFKTPLGTNHAFQGWADVFLTTPNAGLIDTYFTVVGNVAGAKLIAVYHDFETDKGSLDAGDEFDVMLQKTFMEHYTLGISYADYNADKEFGGVDTDKFWLYGQLKF